MTIMTTRTKKKTSMTTAMIMTLAMTTAATAKTKTMMAPWRWQWRWYRVLFRWVLLPGEDKTRPSMCTDWTGARMGKRHGALQGQERRHCGGTARRHTWPAGISTGVCQNQRCHLVLFSAGESITLGSTVPCMLQYGAWELVTGLDLDYFFFPFEAAGEDPSDFY